LRIDNAALSPLFMAADVMSTKVVNETLNEFTEDSLLAWERAKQGGLNQALMFVQHSQGAKMLELKYLENVSQEAHEKLLNNEFKSLKEFNESTQNVDDIEKNRYTVFFYRKEQNENTKYLIDSIFLR
jgi:ketol-acid reductoisomerase